MLPSNTYSKHSTIQKKLWILQVLMPPPSIFLVTSKFSRPCLHMMWPWKLSSFWVDRHTPCALMKNKCVCQKGVSSRCWNRWRQKLCGPEEPTTGWCWRSVHNHHIHSIGFLKSNVSIKPSVPPSGSHKCLRFGLSLKLHTIKDYIYLDTYMTACVCLCV